MITVDDKIYLELYFLDGRIHRFCSSRGRYNGCRRCFQFILFVVWIVYKKLSLII